MKEKFGKYALLALVWVIVVGYVVCSMTMLSVHRAELVVKSVDIEICDSTSNGQLVSSRKVREWLLHSGISTIGTPIDEVDLSGIENMVAKNGFVDRVNTYVSYDGVLHIEVNQRRPMLRLLIDGYDTYVTETGFVFRSPSASALYVPVVTGGYKPPFPAGYEGNVRDYIDSQIAESNKRITTIGKEKKPRLDADKALREKYKEVSGKRIRQGLFQDDEEFEAEVKALKEQKRSEKREINRKRRYIAQCIDEIEARQEGEYRKQKKLEKRYEDFLKLINFVSWLEGEPFWSAEVVQIVAQTMPSGALEIELIPRSGDYTILFGRLENVEEKFEKLLHFYEDGLNKVGWDKYSTINIKYDGQVVCSK